mgnify:CR=1 FL=1
MIENDSKLSIEKSASGRRALVFNARNKNGIKIPQHLLRDTEPLLPELSELEVIRHYTLLSHKNFSLDANFYPLGSCTMKYNPRINEIVSSLKNFEDLHPLSDDACAQGTLELLYHLEKALCEICAMDATTLTPAAGAHGEFTGAAIVKAYFENKGEKQRVQIVIPDSAHGTNPATSSMLGFETVEIKSNEKGQIDIETLKKALSERTAMLMLTIPNTLGIFEADIEKIVSIAHNSGVVVYMDGANMNALIGILKPGDMGIDLMHLNMHKTFSTPHGGGGPGAGAICVKKYLEPFLPVPRVIKEKGMFRTKSDCPLSIGKIKSFFGNTAVLIKSYAYILSHSNDSLSEISKNAIINANYLLKKLGKLYPPHNREYCMHECVLSCPEELLKNQVRTLDVAKRLLDFGLHAPTVYFPLIVKEALMIEPTETESKETLDAFIQAMQKIYEEGKYHPETLKKAPINLATKRMDETFAARNPDLRWESKKTCSSKV